METWIMVAFVTMLGQGPLQWATNIPPTAAATSQQVEFSSEEACLVALRALEEQFASSNASKFRGVCAKK